MEVVEFRRQVVRRIRYGLNVVAIERDVVPFEGPFDVALTNGLAAIVASEHPGSERYPSGSTAGRVRSAGALLDELERYAGNAAAFDFAALREAIKVTQPLRHGDADDEFLSTGVHHLQALTALDDHPSLAVLPQARMTGNVGGLASRLFRDAAAIQTGIAWASPKERLTEPELEECEDCGRPTFLRHGWDEFGGEDAAGECVACGYRLDEETARDRALGAAIERAMSRDD